MPEVWVTPAMQRVTGWQHLRVPGSTIRQVIASLESAHPDIGAHLRTGDEILPGLAVIVDGMDSGLGMMQSVEEDSEVHFLPSIGGG